MAPTFYYDKTGKQSTQAALDLKLVSYFSKLLFKNDITRVIYASNEFCFRERLRRLQEDFPLPAVGIETRVGNSLELPFMNFWQQQEPLKIDRGWRSPFHVINGTFIDELGTNLQIAPAGYSYQATAFFKHEADLDYAYDALSWVAQYPLNLQVELSWVPTGVEPGNPTGGVVVFPINAVIGFDLQYNPKYNENDWLAQERILSIGLDFTVQSFRMRLVDPSVGSFWIPTSVVFDFANQLELDPTGQTFEQLTNLVIDQTLGTVTDPTIQI